MTLLPTGQIRPGAVPIVWGITVAPSGTSAWRSLLAGIVQPGRREAKQVPDGLEHALVPAKRNVHHERDRLTGDDRPGWVRDRRRSRPPRFARGRRRSAEAMRSMLSPTLVWKLQSIPDRASCSPIQAELVSIDLAKKELGTDGDHLGAQPAPVVARRSGCVTAEAITCGREAPASSLRESRRYSRPVQSVTARTNQRAQATSLAWCRPIGGRKASPDHDVLQPGSSPSPRFGLGPRRPCRPA